MSSIIDDLKRCNKLDTYCNTCGSRNLSFRKTQIALREFLDELDNLKGVDKIKATWKDILKEQVEALNEDNESLDRLAELVSSDIDTILDRIKILVIERYGYEQERNSYGTTSGLLKLTPTGGEVEETS